MKIIAFFFVLSLSLYAHDPVGEVANYLVDKNPARTSSIVKSGTVEVTVPKVMQNSEGLEAFQVMMNYNFNFTLYGPYKGTEETAIEKEYFSESFLEKLEKRVPTRAGILRLLIKAMRMQRT